MSRALGTDGELRHVRSTPEPFTSGSTRGPVVRAKDEAATIGVLLRQLGEDLSGLLQDELALAKLELRREARGLGSDLRNLGIAAGLAFLGAQAVLAFLILALGLALGNYWAAALIVAVVLLGIGGALGWSAAGRMSDRSPVPTATMDSLREDARWAKQETETFKREVRR